MGEAGELAYEKSNLVRNVTMFRHIRYLLIHGMADGLSKIIINTKDHYK